MSLSMATLLVHDPVVPAAARDAIRRGERETAARVLYESGVECADALELVDLDARECGCEG